MVILGLTYCPGGSGNGKGRIGALASEAPGRNDLSFLTEHFRLWRTLKNFKLQHTKINDANLRSLELVNSSFTATPP